MRITDICGYCYDLYLVQFRATGLPMLIEAIIKEGDEVFQLGVEIVDAHKHVSLLLVHNFGKGQNLESEGILNSFLKQRSLLNRLKNLRGTA